jgi:hypothetical protein
VWNDLKRFAQIPRTRKMLLCEALLALAIARAAMVCLPFRWIAAWLGTPGAETPGSAADNEILMGKEIGWAVTVLARRVPWDGRCLVQAIAAGGMLRRRGLEGTVSFGAGRDNSAEFSAHAWLRLGPLVVTGGPGHERFKTFTTFARRRA